MSPRSWRRLLRRSSRKWRRSRAPSLVRVSLAVAAIAPPAPPLPGLPARKDMPPPLPPKPKLPGLFPPKEPTFTSIRERLPAEVPLATFLDLAAAPLAGFAAPLAARAATGVPFTFPCDVGARLPACVAARAAPAARFEAAGLEATAPADREVFLEGVRFNLATHTLRWRERQRAAPLA